MVFPSFGSYGRKHPVKVLRRRPSLGKSLHILGSHDITNRLNENGESFFSLFSLDNGNRRRIVTVMLGIELFLYRHRRPSHLSAFYSSLWLLSDSV